MAYVVPPDKIQLGVQIGDWTALESATRMNDRVRCRCKCGAVHPIILYNLASGRSTKCRSCIAKSNRLPKYGEPIRGSDFERMYWIWMRMKDRCKSTIRQNSHLYSLRGITVSPEWQNDFAAFREWSLANGYRDELTLDRWPDKNGNYEPSNCRWATWKQQGRNTRRNRLLTAFGETKTLIEWTEDPRCIVSYSAFKQRLDIMGWPIEQALGTPYSIAHDIRTKKARGSENGNSQLTADAVKLIRQLCADGVSQGVIAERFGIARCTVSAIHVRRLWRWLP